MNLSIQPHYYRKLHISDWCVKTNLTHMKAWEHQESQTRVAACLFNLLFFSWTPFLSDAVQERGLENRVESVSESRSSVQSHSDSHFQFRFCSRVLLLVRGCNERWFDKGVACGWDLLTDHYPFVMFFSFW